MPKKPLLKVLTIEELNKAAAAIEKKLARAVNLDKKNATCTINIKYPYEVDLDPIHTERDLLAITLHLAEKSWMKTQHLAYFIRTVAKYKGFRLHTRRMNHSQN